MKKEVKSSNNSQTNVSKIFPEIHFHMDRLGIKNAAELFRRCLPKIIESSTEMTPIAKHTHDRFIRIINGTTSPWDVKSGELTPEADVISTLFETNVESLFGEAPAPKGYAQTGDYPYNKEFHRLFQQRMKEAGFHSIGALKKALVLNAQPLSYLSRGQSSPFANDQWTSLAQEVACLLNMSPEELFGVTDRQTTYADDAHLDNEDDGDGWVMDNDDLIWTREKAQDYVEEQPPNILRYLCTDFNSHNGTFKHDDNHQRPTSLLQNFRLVVGASPSVLQKSWEELYDLKRLREEFESCSYLTKREKRILSYRFGLETANTEMLGHADFSFDAQSQNEVADIMGLRKERLWQLEARAMRHLRNKRESDKFIEVGRQVWSYNHF